MTKCTTQVHDVVHIKCPTHSVIVQLFIHAVSRVVAVGHMDASARLPRC